MAWMNRYAHLPVSVLGAIVIAGCSSNPPPGDGAACDYERNDQGALVCVTPTEPGASTGASGSSNAGGGPVTVPDLGGGTTPASGTGGSGTGSVSVPDLTAMAGSGGSAPSSNGGSAGSAVSNGGSAGSAVSNGGSAGSAVSNGGSAGSAVSNGGSAPVAGGGNDPVAGSGNDPVAGSGSMDPPTGSTLGSIVVSAGALARDHTIVTFSYPDGQGKNLALTDSQGNQIPLEISPADGKATFILASLGAGEQATFTIQELSQALPAGITATVEPDTTGDQLFLTVGERRVFRWTLVEDNFRGAQARDVRAGYIYPVYTPNGLNVADDYQVDHPHMHGIWSAWTNTTFHDHHVDFWNGYDLSGRVDLASMDGIWSGPVHAGLIANLVHSDITVTPSVPALNEKWIVTVYKTHDGTPPYFIYDIDSVQETAGPDPLILEQYHYGGFGFRGSEEWQDPANVTFLTSEGQNRAQGDGQRADWVAQYGPVGGQTGGYAGLGHPDNFRSPQGLRLHPTNPYWAFVPCTQSAGGRFTIDPGVPYHSQFRVVAFDGPADAALLDRLWNDFATPPTVEVLPP